MAKKSGISGLLGLAKELEGVLSTIWVEEF